MSPVLVEYWWILPTVLFFAVLAVVMRRGKWATAGQKIYFVSICVGILVIPTTPKPASYLLAVGVVLNLWIYRSSLSKRTFVLERSSNTTDSDPSDR